MTIFDIMSLDEWVDALARKGTSTRTIDELTPLCLALNERYENDYPSSIPSSISDRVAIQMSVLAYIHEALRSKELVQQ